MSRALAVLLALAACASPPVQTIATKPRPTAVPVAVPAPQPPEDIGCHRRSATGLARCPDAARIEEDIRLVAHPRPPGSKHHAAVRALCAERLKGLRYAVEMHDYGSGVNVVGTKRGRSTELVIVSAHYDHIPDCSGADDNASGVAVALETARVLADARFEHTLVVACWDEEESGLIGSRAYAKRARGRNDSVIVAVSLDGVGFASDAPGSQRVPVGFERIFPREVARLAEREYRGDFVAVLGDTSSEPFVQSIERHASVIDLPVQALAMSVLQRVVLQDAHRSDHSSFWMEGYPAMLLSDTADFRNPRYHCGAGDDAVDSVSFGFATDVTRATVGMAADALQVKVTGRAGKSTLRQ